MTINVLFFGMSRDITGQASEKLTFNEELTVESFKDFIHNKYPELSRIKSFSIAVNESYAEGGCQLKDKDVLAIIPPVSGG